VRERLRECKRGMAKEQTAAALFHVFQIRPGQRKDAPQGLTLQAYWE
jgi:hypothetical protein